MTVHSGGVAPAAARMPARVRSALPSMKAAPLPVWLLVASFLSPTELSLYLGSLRLPPHRVMLLALILPAIVRLMKDRGLRLRLYDGLFLAYALWTVSVFMHHQGGAEGLQFGGSLALESFAGFVVARAYVRDATSFLASISLLVAAVALSGLIALPEALSGVHFVHDVLRDITGYVHPIGHETRLFLTRAYGTFDHPIHLGTYCASALALIWYATPPRYQTRRAMIIAACTLLGMSSAPILCLVVQLVLIGWDYVTRSMRGRVGITLAFIGLLYAIAAAIGTRSPITIIATGFTLDSWTGFYRTLIWQHGLENVWDNPWIGLGLGDWTRPAWMVSASVDAFWLIIAMRAGIPAFLLLVLAIALLARGVLRGPRRDEPDLRRFARGWMMSLIALSLIACTVHFWNVLHAYFFFFLGLAAWIGDHKRRPKPAEPEPAPQPRQSGQPQPRQRAAGPPPPRLPAPMPPVMTGLVRPMPMPARPSRRPDPAIAVPAGHPAGRVSPPGLHT